MARPSLKRVRKPATGPNPDRLYSCAIVHLGDGDLLAAIRHLGRASECMERWASEKETGG